MQCYFPSANCRNQDGQDLRMNMMSGMNRTKCRHALDQYPVNPIILTILIPTVCSTAETCGQGRRESYERPYDL